MTEKELERLYGNNEDNTSETRIDRKVKKSSKVNKKVVDKTKRKAAGKKSDGRKKNKVRHIRLRLKKIFFILFALCMIILSLMIYNDSKKVTICIDAGHGGHDTGAISNDGTRYEKDDNLKLAIKVKSELESSIKKEKLDIRVLLTRDKDEYVELADRCKIANRKNAIMFISLHRNSLDKSNAKGIETWINNYKNESEIELANTILNEVNKCNVSENRGIKYGTTQDSNKNYYVNEHTRMKSIIMELGFISNDYDNMLYDLHMDSYAKAISDGIMIEAKNMMNNTKQKEEEVQR